MFILGAPARPDQRRAVADDRQPHRPAPAVDLANLTVANWLGIGEENVVKVAATDDNQIRLDDLAGLVRVRDALVTEYRLDYVPHVHADAVIGWAWSVFTDYDFDRNPLGFRHRTVRAIAGTLRRIRHLGLAHSIGIDYHVRAVLDSIWDARRAIAAEFAVG